MQLVLVLVVKGPAIDIMYHVAAPAVEPCARFLQILITTSYSAWGLGIPTNTRTVLEWCKLVHSAIEIMLCCLGTAL